MHKIFSKIDKNNLLHVISYLKDKEDLNQHISEPAEYLQSCKMKFPKNHIIKRHKHVKKDIKHLKKFSQESILIVKGSIELDLYDLDNSMIESISLSAGDLYILYRGSYKFISNNKNTLLYKIKA